MDQRHIYPTPDDLAQQAAAFIVDLAQKAVRETGRFTLCLSGGTTPELLFKQLAALPCRDQMPWPNTFVFWGDERCVPADDPRNNAFIAKSILLNQVHLLDTNVFPIPVHLPPEAAAMQYEQTLHQIFDPAPPRFDLILLGMGSDGHTASLFPESPVLNEKIRWVREVYVAEQQMYRVTMTLPLINQAKNIVILVSGRGKAEMLQAVLAKEAAKRDVFPVQYVRPEHGALHWFLDVAAAALL